MCLIKSDFLAALANGTADLAWLFKAQNDNQLIDLDIYPGDVLNIGSSLIYCEAVEKESDEVVGNYSDEVVEHDCDEVVENDCDEFLENDSDEVVENDSDEDVENDSGNFFKKYFTTIPPTGGGTSITHKQN